MQIIILGLNTVGAHSLCFPNSNRQLSSSCSLSLRKGKLILFSELACGLEQALGYIQQLEAAVHSEC